MAGGYPKWVWSPSGGWQWQDVMKPGMQGAHNKNWARNTGIALAASFAFTAYLFNVSRQIEQRPQEPVRKIPSIHWWGRKELRDAYPDPKPF
ncbi:hypothetical protein GUITHDRAFT_151701 [Guillardia theta CCMP2712]|uniref:Uncharacterized protein n=2 Tax=Guillardia theta TaxID=55529 RepID=L1JJZ4_GUITC|nr:hypothetical protein GUITHDRAFT_151701 [Guillardia theta CCMP2712]EKX48833.1 hypothetical protein GUITHDRAFT_151701 [Guillardia theta CCMP2712]|eukprot:XP_005835813.1 hypothetical protein GUITHDRAFT_151701 [Guillardia theta CCMP2712]